MSPMAVCEPFNMIQFMNEIIYQSLTLCGFESISNRYLKYCFPPEAIKVLIQTRTNKLGFYHEILKDRESMVLGNGTKLEDLINWYAKEYLLRVNFANEFAGFVGILMHLAIYRREKGLERYTDLIIGSSVILHQFYPHQFFENLSAEYLLRCLCRTGEFYNALINLLRST